MIYLWERGGLPLGSDFKLKSKGLVVHTLVCTKSDWVFEDH